MFYTLRHEMAILFSNFPIAQSLIAILSRSGFRKPTDIQNVMIPKILSKQDAIFVSQTGSGKTLGYLLPILERVLSSKDERALILTPTRETADQILKVLKLFSDELLIPVSLVIGGRSSKEQLKELKAKARVIVATPGRLNDHLMNNKLLLQGVTAVVVDEADRMLDMGFLPQLSFIRKTMRGRWDTVMCSASSPEVIKEFFGTFANGEGSPEQEEVTVMAEAEKAVSTLSHEVVRLRSSEKPERLLHDLNSEKGSILVFVASQERCDDVFRFCKKQGLLVDHLHGGLRQGHRNRVLRDFRGEAVKILIATDVLARGLDVSHVNLVINLDLPYHAEDFLHRIGRTARAGRKGRAVTYLTERDEKMFERIEGYLK